MDKKHKIISAAIVEFAKNGFEKASMDTIALKAKVAKGTIFYHFRSKNELFFGIVDESQKRLSEEMKREIKKMKTSQEKLEKIIDIEVNFIKKYRDLFLIYLEDVVKKTISFEVINEVIEGGIKSGEFRKNLNIEITSIGLFWMTAMICVNSKKIDAEEIKKLIIDGIKLD